MKNLYVGNLPHSTTEAELRTLFETHGAVEKVSVVTDRETGRARGFGFVEMTDASEAEKAIAALNGTQLGGRALTINEAKPKTDRPKSGCGGGRGRRISRRRVCASRSCIRRRKTNRIHTAGTSMSVIWCWAIFIIRK